MSKLDVKVGDKVVINSMYGRSVRTVEKITPKGAIKVDGTLYTPDGIEKGGNCWVRRRIEKATDEIIQDIREKSYISKTLSKMTKCVELTYEQAIRINEILDSEV